MINNTVYQKEFRELIKKKQEFANQVSQTTYIPHSHIAWPFKFHTLHFRKKTRSTIRVNITSLDVEKKIPEGKIKLSLFIKSFSLRNLL